MEFNQKSSIKVKVTVIVCTYNRCQQLAKALESAANLRLPDSVPWEVLVVDNNSNDKTREMVEDFSRRHSGRFHYLFEPRPGKSYALNTGIREAMGDILAFMDDDVIVDSLWLHNLTSALNTGEWAGVGGRVLPDQKFSPPPWLSLNKGCALGPLVIFNLGDEAGELKEPPIGTNMAFPRKMFEKYGGFRTDLGPRPGSEIRGEDVEFGRRLLLKGERLRYEPSAVVYHPVTEERIQRKYFLAWWYDKARADIRESSAAARANRWTIYGIPLYLFRRLAVGTIRWMMAIQPARRFACKISVWFQLGAIVESYHRARGAKSGEIRPNFSDVSGLQNTSRKNKTQILDQNLN